MGRHHQVEDAAALTSPPKHTHTSIHPSGEHQSGRLEETG